MCTEAHTTHEVSMTGEGYQRSERASSGRPSARSAAAEPANGTPRLANGGPELALGAPRLEIWGVLNVTPDSFSDGGRFFGAGDALAHGRALVAEGAVVVDVGGASSRPRGQTYGAGAAPVDADEEVRRTRPIVEALVAGGVRVSIDTTSAEVAEAALRSGATIVNDVSMGASAALLEACARHGAELVLMHTRGDGRLDAITTQYDDVVADVLAELEAAALRAIAHGVEAERIWLDPGLGFAKTAEQSLALLAATDRLVATGRPVLVGASRKSFLAAMAPDPSGALPGTDARLGGSLAAVCTAVWAGARAVRVHDVRASRQAARITELTMPARRP